MYGVALIVGAALAVWAGVPVPFLLILLVCPLMMFFMMRGMHGGQGSDHGQGSHDQSGQRSRDAHTSEESDRPRPDGSHERIDQP